MKTQYRWKSQDLPNVFSVGPWRDFRTLAALDAMTGGGTGADGEIEMRAVDGDAAGLAEIPLANTAPPAQG